MNDSFLNHAGKRRTGDAAKTDPVCRAGRRGELLLLTGVTICALAEKTAWISLAWMIALSAAAAVISTVWYGRLLMRIKNDGRKAMLRFTLESILSFLVCVVIDFDLKMQVSFPWIPLRETNAADGIVIFFLWGCFILISVVAKICVFAAIGTKKR